MWSGHPEHTRCGEEDKLLIDLYIDSLSLCVWFSFYNQTSNTLWMQTLKSVFTLILWVSRGCLLAPGHFASARTTSPLNSLVSPPLGASLLASSLVFMLVLWVSRGWGLTFTPYLPPSNLNYHLRTQKFFDRVLHYWCKRTTTGLSRSACQNILLVTTGGNGSLLVPLQARLVRLLQETWKVAGKSSKMQ